MFLKFFGKKKSSEDSAQDVGQLVNGIDPEMNYCPECEVEFRSDIEKCPSCNVSLITGKKKIVQQSEENASFNSRNMQISPEDELVSIRKGPLKDMKVLQSILKKERIPAILAGDDDTCGKGCCGPEMIVQIRSTDIDEATAVLARDFVKSTALNVEDLKHADVVFDEQAAETVCPACGCKFSPTVGACPECGLCFA
ncbi:zinc ribbon-containing (seleno)protein DG [Desulforhopalus sp. 52FAK]